MEILLVPLGGYVKMYGDADAASSKKNKKAKEDDKFSFHNKSSSKIYDIICFVLIKFYFSFFVLVFINCYFGFNNKANSQ